MHFVVYLYQFFVVRSDGINFQILRAQRAQREKRRKKRKKKTKCKSKGINVINISVQNGKVFISEQDKGSKAKGQNEKLSDVLLEDMIQIQHQMLSHFGQQPKTAVMDGMSSSLNATTSYRQQKSPSHSEEDEKLETNQSEEIHLAIPKNEKIHDRNASFSSSMNGHLMHFHEEELLEISNESSRQRTVLSESEKKEFDQHAHHDEEQDDVLDLGDDSVCFDDDDDDQMPLPSISEMSFDAWTLPQNSTDMMAEREKSHYVDGSVDDNRQGIIDLFLEENDCVCKKDLGRRRSRKMKSVAPRKQRKNRKKTKNYNSTESKQLEDSETSPVEYGIDDIFNSFNNLETVKRQRLKKNKKKKKKMGKRKSVRKKKKKKNRKRCDDDDENQEKEYEANMEKIKNLHIDLNAEYMEYSYPKASKQKKKKLPVLRMDYHNYHHGYNKVKLPISHQSMQSLDEPPNYCRFNHFNGFYQNIPIPPAPKQIQPQH